MNKADAQKIVYNLTTRSLRNVAKAHTWPKFPEVAVNITAADKDKIRKEMRELADRLEKKFPDKPAVDGDVI